MDGTCRLYSCACIHVLGKVELQIYLKLFKLISKLTQKRCLLGL